jgi:hypothetical protein
MGSKKFFYKNAKQLTIAMQAGHLRHSFPEAKLNLHKNNLLTWHGVITPTPLSQSYHVTIQYRLGERPDVTISDPPLKTNNGQKIPHVFSGNRLCLFRYKYYEWDSGMRIDNTIIPWTSLWLFFYEIWLATGTWCGGGEHAGEDKQKLETE